MDDNIKYNALTSLGMNVLMNRENSKGESIILASPSVGSNSVYILCHLNSKGEIKESRTYMYSDNTRKEVFRNAKKEFQRWKFFLSKETEDFNYELGK